MTEAIQVAWIAGGCAAATATIGNFLTWLSTRSKVAAVAAKVEESKAQNVAIASTLDATKATVARVEQISDGRLTEALDKITGAQTEITSLKGMVAGLQAIIVKHNGGDKAQP
jgi:hypothetical protein